MWASPARRDIVARSRTGEWAAFGGVAGAGTAAAAAALRTTVPLARTKLWCLGGNFIRALGQAECGGVCAEVG